MKIYVALIASALATSASAREVILNCVGAKANGEAVQYAIPFDEEARTFNGSIIQSATRRWTYTYMESGFMGNDLIRIDRSTGNFAPADPKKDIGSGVCTAMPSKF